MAGEWPKMTLREANVTLIDCDHRMPPDRISCEGIEMIRSARPDGLTVELARKPVCDHAY